MPAAAPPEEIKRLVALFKDGRLAELEPLAAQFACTYPTHGLGWMLLAATHKSAKRFEEALAAQFKAIDAMPGRPELFSNLGNIQLALGRLADAEASYRNCLRLDPNHVDGNFNLGVLLLKVARPREAEWYLRRALSFEPDSPEFLRQTAVALLDQNQFSHGAILLQQALARRADYAEALDSLGYACLHLSQLDRAIEVGRAAVKLCPEEPQYLSNLLFALNYAHGTPEDTMDLARAYGKLVSEKVREQRMRHRRTDSNPDKLRIGFVSGDFKNHPVTHFLLSLLDHVDRARFECLAYATVAFEDDYTRRIKARVESWKVLSSIEDADAASMIRADGIHILVDLAGHSAHNRLPVFSYKPAPVQITWLGYFSTTGVPEIDYILVDETSAPATASNQFTETVWRLPHTRLCFTPPGMAPEVNPLPALENGYVTFGCYQNAAKINDEVLECWADIFRALPQARLRIQSPQFADNAARQSMGQRLRDAGMSETQFELLGPEGLQAYLRSHHQVDMVLDTFPFPGGTTTCEALWMGVPTVTLAGSTLLSRQGASLMTAAGLGEWVARDRAEYRRKALGFAADLAALAALRAGLRATLPRTPLFDGAWFARDFETAMSEIWRSRAPDPFN